MTTLTDAARVQAFADEVGDEGPVAIAGHRTRPNLGGEVAASVRTVIAPTGIVGFAPEEMIVAVAAGTAVADLHDELASAGQRTALSERGGTVGGALAVGENHLSALGRGRLRNCLLQVRYVSAEGKTITGGGPTVKNVTGFDLPRLIVGSLGTLGFIAEVILRTNPIPAVTAWVAAEAGDPFAARDAVINPSAVLWDGTTTWVELEGHAVDVDAELDRLRAVAPFAEVEGPPTLGPERWSLAPGDLRSIAQHVTGPFVASIGLGTVWADQPQPRRDLSPELRIVSERTKQQFDPTGRLNPGRSVM